MLGKIMLPLMIISIFLQMIQNGRFNSEKKKDSLGFWQLMSPIMRLIL